MAYIKKTYRTGKVIEVEKKHTVRCQSKKRKAVPRAPKENETSDAQKKVNENNAIKKLRRLVNNNFGYGDAHVVLNYLPGNRPKTKEDVRAAVENFLKALRKIYKKMGKVLKYILTTEYGERSIHHHMIINEADLKVISEAWVHGRPHITMLDDSGQYKKLASYLIKQTSKTFNDPEKRIYSKRWNASTNLIAPVPIVENSRADSWMETPKPLKGYYIEDVITDINPITGYPYQYYTMIALGDSKEKVKGRGSINEDDSNHQFKRRGG